MESEERPRKLQKLDHGESVEQVVEAISETGSGLEQNDLDNGDLPFSQSSPANYSDTNSWSGTILSKNQQKKLRKQREWEAGREWRRQRRKEKLAEKKERKRSSRSMNQRVPTGAENQEDGNSKRGAKSNGEEKKKHPQRSAIQIPVAIILDCAFDELMVDKERISLASQITRCYSDVKNALYRPQLAVSSFNELLKERFDGPLGGQYRNWKGVKFKSEGFVDVAKELGKAMTAKGGGISKGPLAIAELENGDGKDGEVVYLSSDSPHTLAVLKPHGTYIIGGLVDKNRHKGICYKRAMEAGIKTAKLPIGNYLEMNSRSVLATNHVVEIMVKWLELGDWGQAFMAVMPKRKGGVLKSGGRHIDEIENVDTNANQSVEDPAQDAESKKVETESLSEAGD